jgi:hypothetical protein
MFASNQHDVLASTPEGSRETTFFDVARFMASTTHRPVKCVLQDGSVSWYFCQDLIAYKQALLSGEFPRDRTFLGFPPASS